MEGSMYLALEIIKILAPLSENPNANDKYGRTPILVAKIAEICRTLELFKSKDFLDMQCFTFNKENVKILKRKVKHLLIYLFFMFSPLRDLVQPIIVPDHSNKFLSDN